MSARVGGPTGAWYGGGSLSGWRARSSCSILALRITSAPLRMAWAPAPSSVDLSLIDVAERLNAASTAGPVLPPIFCLTSGEAVRSAVPICCRMPWQYSHSLACRSMSPSFAPWSARSRRARWGPVAISAPLRRRGRQRARAVALEARRRHAGRRGGEAVERARVRGVGVAEVVDEAGQVVAVSAQPGGHLQHRLRHVLLRHAAVVAELRSRVRAPEETGRDRLYVPRLEVLGAAGEHRPDVGEQDRGGFQLPEQVRGSHAPVVHLNVFLPPNERPVASPATCPGPPRSKPRSVRLRRTRLGPRSSRCVEPRSPSCCSRSPSQRAAAATATIRVRRARARRPRRRRRAARRRARRRSPRRTWRRASSCRCPTAACAPPRTGRRPRT